MMRRSQLLLIDGLCLQVEGLRLGIVTMFSEIISCQPQEVRCFRGNHLRLQDMLRAGEHMWKQVLPYGPASSKGFRKRSEHQTRRPLDPCLDGLRGHRVDKHCLD